MRLWRNITGVIAGLADCEELNGLIGFSAVPQVENEK
jgi:hypothetical protein